MIEGVTILTTEVITKTAPGIEILLCVFGAFVVSSVILFITGLFTDNERLSVPGIIMLAICFLSVPVIIGLGASYQTTDYNQYEVIIEDSVSLNDFMKEYEILEQRGQIYIIKEIEE